MHYDMLKVLVVRDGTLQRHFVRDGTLRNVVIVKNISHPKGRAHLLVGGFPTDTYDIGEALRPMPATWIVENW